MPSELSDLYLLSEGLRIHWATAENPTGEKGGACTDNDGRKRRANVPLKAGDTAVLAQSDGVAGVVRRIWITISDLHRPAMLRGLKLAMYWDGGATPAVSAPLGDFFCQGLGRMSAFQNVLFSSPEARSFNCCIPMPFRSGMRIELTNETTTDLPNLFYEVDFTTGDAHGDDVLYFHSHWRRENPTTPLRDFELLPTITGRGRFLGANFSVIANTRLYFKSWWGEGEVKVFIDDDKAGHPTLCGTGTEDYIGTGWGQGPYAHAYQGCPVADPDAMAYAFYRLHIPDPICFYRNLRVTIQQIGCWDPNTIVQMRDAGLKLSHGAAPVDMDKAVAAKGYGLFERKDDWAACSYFYLNGTENGLPAIQPAADRIAGLDAPAK